MVPFEYSHKNSFMPRTVRDWNHPPSDVINRMESSDNPPKTFSEIVKGGGAWTVIVVLGTLVVGERDKVISEDVSSAESRKTKDFPPCRNYRSGRSFLLKPT